MPQSSAPNPPVPLGSSIPVVTGGASAAAHPGVPSSGPLADRWGRTATDLRISLIDKCNLRCIYCMPAEGLNWLPGTQLLTLDEVTRLVRVGVRDLGIEEVRFTGGEPLVRADLTDIIAAVRAEHPHLPIALTTNGIGLDKKVDALVQAGLNRVNVSLDTICSETFAQLTRRDKLASVLAGIEAAASAGLTPLKINAVLMPGINDEQGHELLAWALEGGYQLRFIEQMPLDADHNWTQEGTITAEQIRQRLAAHYDLLPHGHPRGASPAALWDVYPLGKASTAEPLGQVGIIASVTEPFCSACTRTRITADGRVRSCLFSLTETDLMGALRGGASDAELARIWRRAMWAKPKAHGKNKTGFDTPDFTQPERSMSAIGG
ncbi:cyclic pyranopterin phosphate synthase [Rothia nasimurium]|uniref:GTP 3',8-cyclase n=1 Tax=Rothia nasimurium TaxID=85336 RepID=A0A1Y1RRQ3_9MICC|nr:GTP 3',8-cyclase MoaA [Rothia nasimurium]ORC24139.1 cyclic pyranopterin phosphate synthase [Rothia nasimurium]